MMIIKKCRQCGEDFDAESNRRRTCDSCKRKNKLEASKRYHLTEAGREARRRGWKKYRERHPEEVAERYRKWREKNKVHARTVNRRYYYSHLDQCRTIRRNYYWNHKNEIRDHRMSVYHADPKIVAEKKRLRRKANNGDSLALFKLDSLNGKLRYCTRLRLKARELPCGRYDGICTKNCPDRME